MQDGGGFIFVANDGRLGYKNPITNEESYVSVILGGYGFGEANGRQNNRETCEGHAIEERRLIRDIRC